MLKYFVTLTEDDTTGVNKIALVSDPAILKKGILMKKQDSKKAPTKMVNIAQTMAVPAMQWVVAPVLIPDVEITRIDEETNEECIIVWTSKVIADVYDRYTNKGINEFTLTHDGKNINCTVFKSWITTEADAVCTLVGIEGVPAGSWMMAIHIADPKDWKYVQDNELNAFSVEAMMNHELAEFLSPFNQARTASDTTILQRLLNWLFGSKGAADALKTELQPNTDSINDFMKNQDAYQAFTDLVPEKDLYLECKEAIFELIEAKKLEKSNQLNPTYMAQTKTVDVFKQSRISKRKVNLEAIQQIEAGGTATVLNDGAFKGSVIAFLPEGNIGVVNAITGEVISALDAGKYILVAPDKFFYRIEIDADSKLVGTPEMIENLEAACAELKTVAAPDATVVVDTSTMIPEVAVDQMINPEMQIMQSQLKALAQHVATQNATIAKLNGQPLATATQITSLQQTKQDVKVPNYVVQTPRTPVFSNTN